MEEESGSCTSVSVSSFVAARAKEVAALSLQICASSSVENKGLAFQHVPKHLRRRAVSHNVKRLPKRLQQAHLAQLSKSSGGPKKKPKKPSRKHRRRNSNLLSDYNQRQRKVTWLETHIWHAKRFHMDTKWNCKIPVAPCDKGYRALYRAFKSNCAMRDISFCSCIQVTGSHSELGEQFRRITCPSVDTLGIGARYYSTGTREGHVHIYEDMQFPFGFIGQVSFFWIGDSALWLWVHPAYKDQLLNQLIPIFDLSPELEFNTEPKPGESVDEMKLNSLPPPRWTSATSKVTVTDFQGTLNRIRLVGDATFSVLKETLHPSCGIPDKDKGSWFGDFFRDKEHLLKLQSAVWSGAQGSDHFFHKTVLPLTVRDPRLFLPKLRTKETTGNEEGSGDFGRLRDEFLASHWNNPLAHSNVRERILEEKMSDVELNRRRAQLLIPGSELDLGEDENQVPIVLIKEEGNGWDLIVPRGWTLAFWIALSYRCVRPFGLRDADNHVLEFGSVHSAHLPQPDSLFGQTEAQLQGDKAKETYFRYPPAKRPNLVLLKCAFPFRIDWDVLLRRNAATLPPTVTESAHFQPSHSCGFFVLRNCALLALLDAQLKKCPAVKESQHFKYIPVPNADRCLIGVELKMVGKGRPAPLSVISIPDESDVGDKRSETTESPSPCHNLGRKRKELRQKHQKDLAFLRKKRRKLRKQAEGAAEVGHYDSTPFVREFNEEVQSLCEVDAGAALDSMSRTPIGFVTLGGEGLRGGKGRALGYVTYAGLAQFLDKVNCWKRKDVVLLRDCSNSLQYRQAKVHIFKDCF